MAGPDMDLATCRSASPPSYVIDAAVRKAVDPSTRVSGATDRVYWHADEPFDCARQRGGGYNYNGVRVSRPGASPLPEVRGLEQVTVRGIVSGSADGVQRISNPETGASRVLPKGPGGLRTVATLRDERFVSSGRDRLIRFWNP